MVYKELENKNVKDFYNGKIIPGIELNTKVLNIPIEILGYGIDYAKMNNLVKKVYIPAAERNFIEVKRLYKKCIKYGIKLSNNCLDTFSSDTFASVFFHKEITKLPENRKLISDEAWESIKYFTGSICLTQKHLFMLRWMILFQILKLQAT